MAHTALLTQLDRLPWNRFHRNVSLSLGLGWGLDAFEVTLVGSILGVLGPLWHLSAFALSAVLGSWFAGIMLGASGFGALADRYGRRAVFLASLVVYGLATFATAFAPGIMVLLALRFMAGIGVGAEYAAVNAAIAELIPSARRGFAASFVMNFWSVGTLCAALLSWLALSLLPPVLAWRAVFAVGGGVALSAIWLRRRLPESPRWLLAQGRLAEAKAIIGAIAQGKMLLPPRGPVQPNLVRAQRPPLADTLSLLKHHKKALIFGSLLDFAEAGGYYGLFAFLPLAVLPNLHWPATALPPFYMAGSLGALAGGVAVSLLLDRLGRKKLVGFCYGATTLGCLGLAGIAPSGPHAIIADFVLINLLATASWVGAYPTFSELFPTSLRASGIGLCVAIGRIGALISPFLIAYAGQVSLAAALAVLAGFWAIGFATMVVWWFTGVEARGLPLERLSVSLPLERLSVSLPLERLSVSPP